MNGPPIQLVVCNKIKDCLTGSLHLTIGVKDKRRHVTEESYELRKAGDAILFVKDDGEVYEVRPGGSCTCDDAKYRHRPTGCKHCCAARLAGLFGAAQVRAERQTA